jgi:hypothetical protein
VKLVKKETLVFTAFFICAALTFSAASVRADAFSTSEAWIDWTSLTITGDITWLDKGSASDAWANDAIGQDENHKNEAGWVDTFAFASIDGSDYHAYGEALTDDYYLYEEVYAIATKTTTTWANSDADAYRWGDFVANSTGLVEISVYYELSQELTTENAGERASGISTAELWLRNEWDVYPTSDSAEFYNEVSDGGAMSDGDLGLLMVSVYFNTGDAGHFDAGVWNGADVEIPEPAIVALLGLSALALIRRKPAV